MAITTLPSVGNLIKSGSTTDGHVAVWDGTGGYLLKDGGAAATGTVTNVSSANGALTVASPTTAPVITSVYAPALKSATATVDVSAATAPSAGQVLTAVDSTHATWQAASGGGSQWAWTPASASPVTVGTTTTAFSCTGSLSFNATEAARQVMVSTAANFSNLIIKTTNTQGANGTLTATLRINGADTALVVTVAIGAVAGLFSDTTHSVAVSPGDLMDIKFINNDTLTVSSVQNWSILLK